MSETTSDDALHAAGLALAQAVANALDLPEGEPLQPLAFVGRGSDLRLVQFAAPAAEPALAKGKQESETWRSAGSPWALASNGQLASDDPTVDVLIVDLWGPGMEEPLRIEQAYLPSHGPEKLKVLGPMRLRRHDQGVPAPEVVPLVARIMRGMAQHPQARSVWSHWAEAS